MNFDDFMLTTKFAALHRRIISHVLGTSKLSPDAIVALDKILDSVDSFDAYIDAIKSIDFEKLPKRDVAIIYMILGLSTHVVAGLAGNPLQETLETVYMRTNSLLDLYEKNKQKG